MTGETFRTESHFGDNGERDPSRLLEHGRSTDPALE